MQFRLLGPVEIEVASAAVPLPRRRDRCLLAVLLLELNRVVPVDRLAELLWDGDPPGRARHAIHSHVSRIRTALTGAGGTPGHGSHGVELSTVGGGYRIAADPQSVDAHRFRALHEQASRTVELADRIDQLRAALDLWRGPALGNAASDWLRHRLCADLDERRLSATEDLVSASLAMRREREILPELALTSGAHLGRENLVELHMRALYQAGRRAEALEVYDRARIYLAGELGLDPSPALGAVHQAILRDELMVPTPPPATAAGAAELEPPSAIAPIPRQLPADVAGFTGRTAHLDQLDALLSRTDPATSVVISAIGGTAGVGKTALAVHWAHRAAGWFPDGQLYVNLRGFDPGGAPVPPAEAVRGFLDALQVPPERIPTNLAAQTGLYRSLLAGRRMLVVLDNARDAAQVRPLLPGSPGCRVIVTSRERLSGLVARDGAHRLTLDVLMPDEAQTLLATLLGRDRVDAERDAAAGLARACAYLPLAIRIAAANLTEYPDRTIAGYLADLLAGDRLTALRAFGDEQSAVGAAFDLSYQHLAPAAQRLFRMLALVPGRDFTPRAAAALAGIPDDDAQQLLHGLAGASLVDRRSQGRYAFHDLLRRYAERCSLADDGEPTRRSAISRLLHWYLSTTETAVTMLHPRITRLPLAPPEALPPALEFDDDLAEALAWLDAERANLAAAVRYAADHGPLPLAWLLADRLRIYLLNRGHSADWQTIADAARRSAEAAGDLPAQAASWLSLGNLHDAAGGHPGAAEHYTTALNLARQTDWTDGQASVLNNLARTHWLLGQLPHAAGRLAEALALYRRTGNQAGQATILSNLGNVYQELGRLHQAADHHSQALALHRQPGQGGSVAISLGNLGEVYRDLGQYEQAHTLLTQSIALLHEIGDRAGESGYLSALAALHCEVGRMPEALNAAEAARGRAQEIGDHREQAKALNALGGVLVRLDRIPQAIDCHQRALEVINQTGDSWPRNTARLGLAEAYRRLGDHKEASAHALQALAMARKVGYQLLEGQALTVLAQIRLRQGRCDEAGQYAERAIDNHRATGHRPGETRTMVVLEYIRQAIAGDRGPTSTVA